MLDRVIEHDALIALVDEMTPRRRIVGPVRQSEPACDPPWRCFYREVRHAAQLDLDFNYCVYGPKRFLFPAVETLFEFRRDRRSFNARPVYNEQLTAFVGVHPCDIHAIRLLDRVFSQDHRDPHYLRRRGSTFIIGVDCPRPCTAGVFCWDMGANEAHEGFDVMLYPLHHAGDEPAPPARYGVVFGSRGGREWMHRSGRAALPTVEDERLLEAYLAAKERAFPRALTTRADKLPGLLRRSYDSLLWEATARRCYSCGSCNLSCPTCYCFNVRDENELDGQHGQRLREWDGCQLDGFAEVAGGHNFRATAAARLRHRIYRKATWIRERTGLAGCVGCARCDRACTAKINSVEIYNQLAEEV